MQIVDFIRDKEESGTVELYRLNYIEVLLDPKVWTISRNLSDGWTSVFLRVSMLAGAESEPAGGSKLQNLQSDESFGSSGVQILQRLETISVHSQTVGPSQPEPLNMELRSVSCSLD